MPEAVLFDLDGTLADTAPDLGGALNKLLEEQGRGPLSMDKLRPHVSSGARGMIAAGLGVTPDNPGYLDLQQRFLVIYQGALCVDTRLFAGIAEHLDELDARGIPWGIVTNKSQRFAIPLTEQLGLRRRSPNCSVRGIAKRCDLLVTMPQGIPRASSSSRCSAMPAKRRVSTHSAP